MRAPRPKASRILLALLALIAGPGCARDSIDEIYSLQGAGRYEASLELLKELLDERPDDAELQYLYGIANLETGRISLALWPLREARENSEWAVRAGEALARGALAADDEATAVEAATRVLETQSDNRDMLYVRAEARLSTNRFDEALPDIERLEALDPDDEDARVLRLRCLIGLGRLDEAETLFGELESRSSDPDFPGSTDERYCVARASFAKEKGDKEVAEKRYEECLEKFPDSPLAVHEAIEFFDTTQRPDRSIEILRGAVARDSSWSRIRELLATRLRDRGQAKEAEAVLLEGTKLDRAVAYEAWGGLASHYFLIGDYAASVSAWEEVLKIVDEPAQPEDLFGYAEALLRAGRYDRTLEVAERLPEANAGIIRGLTYLELGQPGEALQHFDAGLRLWPDHAVARYYAAVAAERLGDFDRAIAEYRQSIRSGAGETNAGLRLAELYEAEGAYEKAHHAIGLYVEQHPNEVDGKLAALRIAAQRGKGKVRVENIKSSDVSGASFAAKAAEIIARNDSPDVAVDFLRKAPGIDFTDPGDAEALRALVIQLFAAGRNREALRQVDKALAAHPDAATFHAIRALALERGGAPVADVRAEYARAIELDANCGLALAALGRLDAEGGNAESARSFYTRAAAADPGDVDARRRAAELAAAAGDLDDAQKRFEALLVDRPYDGASAADLAALLVQRGTDPARARSLARQAVRFGGGPDAYALLVETHLEAGEATEAVAALNKAAERRPSDPSLRYQLGRALAVAGRRDAAREAFEQALSAGQFPERSDAASALAALSAKVEGG